MKKFLLSALLLTSSSWAGSVQREFSGTATTSWAVVSAIPSGTVWRSMIIRNKTDGDLAVAFGNTTYPDLIIPVGTDLAISSPALGEVKVDYFGALYIKNVTGTGGTVDFTLIDNNARQIALGSKGNTSPSGDVIVAPTDIKETRFHDASVTGINNSGGAWVQLGGSSAVANSIIQIQITTTIAEPLEIGLGANAGAAVRKFILNRGDGPVSMGVAIAVGDKIWVRSLTSSAVSSGEITLNLGAL